MKNADLRALLDTVDVLRLLTLQGRQEMREFAWWMVVFGLYPAVNVAADVLVGRPFWAESVFLAFWLATIPVAGWLLPSIVWPAAAGLAYGVYVGTRSAGPAVGAVILAITLGLMLLYGYGVRTGRYRPNRPLKLSIGTKVGWG